MPESKMASFYQPDQMLPREILSDHGDSESEQHRAPQHGNSIKNCSFPSVKKQNMVIEVLESRRSSEMTRRKSAGRSTGRRGSSKSTKSRKSQSKSKKRQPKVLSKRCSTCSLNQFEQTPEVGGATLQTETRPCSQLSLSRKKVQFLGKAHQMDPQMQAKAEQYLSHLRQLSGSGERRPLESSAKSPLRLHFDYERDDVLDQITSKTSQINSFAHTSQNTLNLTLGNIPKRESTQSLGSNQPPTF